TAASMPVPSRRRSRLLFTGVGDLSIRSPLSLRGRRDAAAPLREPGSPHGKPESRRPALRASGTGSRAPSSRSEFGRKAAPAISPRLRHEWYALRSDEERLDRRRAALRHSTRVAARPTFHRESEGSWGSRASLRLFPRSSGRTVAPDAYSR